MAPRGCEEFARERGGRSLPYGGGRREGKWMMVHSYYDLARSNTIKRYIDYQHSNSHFHCILFFWIFCSHFIIKLVLICQNNPMKGLLPLWGPDDSFHFNPMLLQKIIKSSYFQKCCRDITDWNTLVDEVYYQAKHLEPLAVGEWTRNKSFATTKINSLSLLL